jgi:flavin reductase
LDKAKYRNGMARLAAAVNLIATDGEAGRHGFTASAVCSVSDEPPTLIVCMNRQARTNNHFKDNGVLSVNVLRSEHEKLSGLFAGGAKSSQERFAAAEWSTLSTGAPVLSGASACFDCVVDRSIEVGTHTVFICTVIDMMVFDCADALVYLNRRYHCVPDLVTPSL